MSEIPTSFYYIVGFLIVTNFGALCTLVMVIFKAGGWVADVKNGINDAKAVGIRAHRRIDKLEEES